MRRSADRLLVVLVGLVVVLAVVAGLVSANRAPASLDPGSPEAVVQRFVQAMVDGDGDTAAALLAPQLGCTAVDLAGAYVPDGARVVLGGSDVRDDHAVVRVEVTEGGGGLLDEGYTHTESFRLERDGETWSINSGAWLLYPCTELKG